MHVLDQALAAGATIVTPNNRLARHVAARFDAARAWYDSPEYRAARDKRKGACDMRMIAVEGI